MRNNVGYDDLATSGTVTPRLAKNSEIVLRMMEPAAIRRSANLQAAAGRATAHFYGMTASKKPAHQSRCLSLLIVLACGICGAQADDLATPTPTPSPAYLNPLARRGELRRLEQSDRRRAAQETSQAKAAARAQNKSHRRSSAAAEAQARAAARDRDQAQRQVAAEARSEAAHATPHPTSDLMARMGFSAQEIAAQKAHETPVTPAPKEPTSAPSPTSASSSAAEPGSP